MTKDDRKVIVTGDRPTARLHLGHYVGSLLNRVKLQDTHKQFVEIADVQALTDNANNPEKVRENIYEVLLDNLAVGVDPKKTIFFVQSMIPQIAELTVYFLNLVTLARLKRNPTVRDEMKRKGYGENVPVGFLTYPVSQAADILAFKAQVVPVGEDQLPVLEQVNEIVHTFNTYYEKVFEKIKPLISETPRLKGLDGTMKMSKSLGNAIFLSDTTTEIEKKVMKMYTDPLHIKKDDPGHIEENVVFEYLDAFDQDTSGLEKLKKDYIQGGVGDVVVKKRLIEVLKNLLQPIRARREVLASDKNNLEQILKEGTHEAISVAEKTLEEVKRAMKINYFE